MLTSVIVAAVLGQSTIKDIAFTARFYTGGADKARAELYIVKSNGTGLKKYATSSAPIDVRWAGENRLVWLSGDEASKTLWTSKLKPWKPVKVASSSAIRAEDSSERKAGPGVAVYLFGDHGQEIVIHPETGKSSPWNTGKNEAQDLFLENGVHTFRMQEYTVQETMIQGPDWQIDGHELRVRPADTVLTFVDYVEDPVGGAMQSLWEWKGKGKPIKIFADVNAFDYWQGRDVFAATTPQKSDRLGETEIFVNQLLFGRISKLPAKPVLDSKMLATSVSIRP